MRRLPILTALLASLALALALSPGASAAAPEFLLQAPEDSVAPGGGAGQLDNPRHVAADPVTGHLYVSELNNSRISEFTAWGAFVKAWGWDVAPGAVDEEQELRVRATAGQFRLSFGAQSTADLPFDASAAAVEAALDALPTIAAGGGGVSVEGGPGDAGGLAPYLVRFDAGPLAGSDVAQLEAQAGTTSLSGGTPSSGVTVSTRANGAAAGVGPETCTAASGCKSGVAGAAPGQFNWPFGLAVDAAGDVYVYDGENRRVQKFDPAGELLLAFGGAGSGDGQFSATFGNFIVHSPTTDTIFVGDAGRIQEFETDGGFVRKIPFAGAFEGKTAGALAADPFGNLYLALAGTEDVFKLDVATTELTPESVEDELTVPLPTAVTADAAGNVYAVNNGSGSNISTPKTILGFDPAGEPIAETGLEDGFGAPAHGVQITGVATNLCAGSTSPGNLYATYFRFETHAYLDAYGTPPAGCEAPPLRPPEILAQYATAVDTDAAVLRAEINPRFIDDTTYYLQYATAACVEAEGWEGACVASKPTPPGSPLTSSVVNSAVKTAGIILEGLEPATAYRFRFLAESSGGGPIRGVGGSEAEDGAEGAFRTFPSAPPPPDPDPCPNGALRYGPAAFLPDCRGYEMVSPLEKNNGDIVSPVNLSAFSTALNQSSGSGNGFAYTSSTPFAGALSASLVSQYLARRDPTQGWLTASLSPPRTTSLVLSLDNEFKAFSPDLCTAWLRTTYDPPLAPGAVSGLFNLYRRGNCAPGDGSYQALTVAEPEQLGAGESPYADLEFQGAAADGSRAVFVAPGNLLGTAAPDNPGSRLQLYLHDEEAGLEFICVLPNGNPTAQGCSAGTSDGGGHVREGSFGNAISADGSRVFWTQTGDGAGPGRIYLRVQGEAASRPVSQSVSGAAARFHGAATDGSQAIFAIEEPGSPLRDNLYRFDVAAEKATLIAEGVEGVMGMSEDASRLYFASTEVLTGEEANSEGEVAEAGARNLYLQEEGVGISFVARLVDEELIPAAIERRPFRRNSRVSPDGLHAAFASTAPLTGYDNTDVASGEPDAEVFLYDAAEAELRCVSCNPSGARPSGREMERLPNQQGETRFWFAARLPTWRGPLYASRLLSDDGGRLFFESVEALVPRDTNGALDVYQWEEGGRGSCSAASPTFNPASEGCVDLISSGQSPRESVFLDASPSGEDVFFATLSSLHPEDPGLVDVYDARVGGGFTIDPGQVECEGEACQSPPAPPAPPTPASASFQGTGNPAAGKPRRRCPKGKRRVTRAGRQRCAKPKKQTKQRKRRGADRRRAGR